MKILIVDDKPENLYLIESILKANGHGTISARNGAEALGFANKEQPDLIISDILMPVMDGYTLCRECKKDSRLQNIPFIFYTATYTDPKDEEFALNLGADRFVLKPQDPDVFIKIIDKCLEKVKTGQSPKITIPELPETVILKEYNQTLIRKLEDKMRQTEENERRLKRYVKELEDSLDALKKTEKALRESEERYRLLQENSIDAILLTAPDGSILSANKAACEMFQMTEKEICERGRSGVVDISDPRLQSMLEERRIKGKVQGELTFIRKSGLKFPAEISSSIYVDSNGDLRSSMIIRDITERKKAESLLSESEKKYRTLITQSPDGIFVVDVNGNFISVNKSMCEGLKYSEADLLTMKIWDMVPDKFKEPFQKRLNKIMNGESINEPMEYEVIGNDKMIHYVEILSAPFYKENILIGFQGIARDVSERKRAEEALRFNEQQLTSIYNTVGDVIFYLAVEPENQFRFITVNPAFSKITGIPANHVLGKTISEVIPTSSIEMVLNNYNTAIKEKKLVRWEETSDYPTGRLTGEVSVRPVFDSRGVCTHLVGSVHDITERKLYEDAIRNSEEKFRITFEEASVGMLLTSLEGKIIDANNAVVSMLKYSKEELMSMRFIDFTYKEDVEASIDWMNKMIAGQLRTHRFEKRYLQKNGEIVFIDANIALMKDASDKPLFFVTHLVDITKRKQAEKALREQDVRLRKLASQIPGMIYQFMQRINGTFCVPYSSEGIRDLFGCSPEDVRDDFTLIAQIILPKDMGKVMDSISKSAEQLTPWMCEFRVQQPGKEIHWLLGKSMPEKQEDGSILWHGFVTNITERKKAEERVNRLAAIVESSEDAIIGETLDGIITSWNKGAEKIYGYSEKEVIGKPLKIIFEEDKYAEFDQIIRKIKASEFIDHYEAVRKRKDGQLINVSLTVSPIKDIEGNIIAASNIARDITERKRYEEEIIKLSEVLSVISNINEMIIHTKNKDELLANSCRIAVQYGIFSMAWMGLVDEKGSIVKPVAFYGKEEGYLSSIKPISILDVPEGEGPTGMAIRSKKYFYCGDIKNDPCMLPWREESLERGYKSSISLPIILYQEAVGAFTLYINEVNIINERELKMLEEVTGNISYALEMLENDAKRVLAEQALKESEENFRSIYENSTLGIYRTATDGKILMASPALVSMLGFSSLEELMTTKNSTPDYYVNIENRKLFKKIIEENGVIHGFETEWKKADGTLITIRESSKAIKDSNGRTLYYEGTVENITEKKELEKKMRLLAHSLESVSECVSITDLDDNILFVNDSFIKKYGYSEKELLGKHISIVRPEESPIIESYQNIIKGTLEGGWKGELINKKKDGSLFPISLSTSIIKDHRNKPIALIGVATDITEMKKAREELIKAKEMAEASDRLKTEFLAQMSHEIRTPINVITSNIEFVQSELEEKVSQEFEEIFTAINLSSQRIIRTIELIINMAELQTGNFKIIPVNVDLDSDILKKLFREFERLAEYKNLEFVYLNKASFTKLTADEYCLKQIFANLIENAIKYTDEGKVVIELMNNPEGDIEVVVRDTGIGIEEDYLAHIFQPFSQEEQGYSRSYEGNGLGLAIVKGYCDLNSASINVKSNKGVGSIFTVTFKQRTDTGAR